MGAFQAFITIATYSQRYIEFLRDGIPANISPEEDTFMTMEEYGPFDLRVYKGGLNLFLQYVSVLMLNDG